MRRAPACAACHGSRLRSIYTVTGIPVHSVLLMESVEEARALPRGDLELAFCEDCGFIQNIRYDPTPQNYSPRCEETQHYSRTFDRWARALAQDLVDRHGLRGKKILEIGCGKGEFLVLLCELGDNEGIGLDPAYRPGRTSSPAASRIQFINDFYDERYTHLKADVIVCRHTLEHIGPVRAFVDTVRRTAGDREDTLIFFEVPAVERVLQEGAFWDVYYEHASYFSLGSLARLFRASGYEVTWLSKAYDDQYLLIEARPAAGPTTPRFPEEDDLEFLARAVDHFASAGPAQIERWRWEIAEAHARGEKIALWGSGSKAVAFLTTTGCGDAIEAVVDVNPHRHGWHLPATGHRIMSPAELRSYQPDLVIAMNRIYLEEIGADLRAMGLSPRLVAL